MGQNSGSRVDRRTVEAPVTERGYNASIITMLDIRVKTMNHDMIRLDLLISHSLNLKPDEDRISRADGKNDARRD